ncbi:uncharacterized protein LOC112343047 [Selaginella moellendorffii]|uniref:uncharacterized protein LOC112343047 n=1 Tax=Selaginella moellendorffii TaxID=88036 RepID=UPI000D1C7BD6|nr:uncharacterized protein LOC112343047 [Selaginella moellendorffii]|eukprot:XP_024521632.1 uncharacterized protein LOC112343047 [Selaginella moellendorffii]
MAILRVSDDHGRPAHHIPAAHSRKHGLGLLEAGILNVALEHGRPGYNAAIQRRGIEEGFGVREGGRALGHGLGHGGPGDDVELGLPVEDRLRLFDPAALRVGGCKGSVGQEIAVLHRVEDDLALIDLAVAQVAVEHQRPGDVVLLRHCVEDRLCGFQMPSQHVFFEDRRPGDDSPEGHSIEKASGFVEEAAQGVGSDHDIPGDIVLLGHGIEERFRLLWIPSVGKCRQERVPQHDVRPRHKKEEIFGVLDGAAVDASSDHVVPGEDVARSHPVEGLPGILHAAAFAVAEEQEIGEIGVVAEAILDELGVRGAAFCQALDISGDRREKSSIQAHALPPRVWTMQRWIPGETRELHARWKRKALQVWRKSLYLDRVVRWDELIYSEIPRAMEFVQSQGGRIDIKRMPAEMDEVSKRRMSKLLRKHAAVFKLTYKHHRTQEWIELRDFMQEIMEAERQAIRDRDEKLSVSIVKKILMMCKDRRAPVTPLKNLSKECAFPVDFDGFLRRYPEDFRLVGGSRMVELVSWDQSLAVTDRERAVEAGRTQRILGPWAFVSTFPKKFEADRIFWEEFDKFQRLPMPSPYEDPGNSADPSSLSGEKRLLAVFHELLSLTIEKRASLAKFKGFKQELRLPEYSDALLASHPRFFYVSESNSRQMAFLREAYRENDRVSVTRVKDPLVTIRNRYMGLLRVEFREPRVKRPCVFSTDESDNEDCDTDAADIP